MALQLKTSPAPAPYTKGAPRSEPACRPYDLGTLVKKAVKRPLGKSSKDAGKAVAEEIIAGLTALHTISEGGSKAFLDVKRQLNDVGMHIHKTGMDNEVRVVPHADKKNADLGYFTDDLEDALHTGLHIAKKTKPVSESTDEDANGHHVETYGGGRYTSVAWYKKKADADAEAKRRHTSGSWSGMPPRVVPGRKIN